MASAVPDNNFLSSPPQDSSSASNLPSKPRKDLIVWAITHQNDPPYREKTERVPGEERIGHGGPARITAVDGVLTEYGKQKERERLAKLGTTEETGREKEVQSSS